MPAAVAIPRDIDAIVSLVRQATMSHLRLIPRGAGSGMPGGNVGTGVIVDLSIAFGGLTIDPHTRTARAGASVTWAKVNEAAKPYGLRLPPDPSSGAFATSGGMVATNAAGPRSVRCGSVRGWIEAIAIVDAEGQARRITRGAGSPKGVPAGPGGRFTLSPEGRRPVAARFPDT